MQKRAFFRFEASSIIGAGHAMRCLVLMRALEKVQYHCIGVTSQTSLDFLPFLKKEDIVAPSIFDQKKMVGDLLVVDHYHLDKSYEQSFRGVVDKILVIDDLANRLHDCDFLLDQTYGRQAQDYHGLVPAHCQMFLGGGFTLLRPEFAAYRPLSFAKRSHKTDVARVVISMGGGDNITFTREALALLNCVAFAGHVDVVTGFLPYSAAQEAELSQDFLGDITFHTQPDMLALLMGADCVIGAAGSSAWERCCLGIPQYVMQLADNQSEVVPLFYHSDFEDFWQALCVKSFLDLSPLSCAIDGLGVYRLLLSVLDMRDKRGGRVSHRRIEVFDRDLIMTWRNDPCLSSMFFNQGMIASEAHADWFEKKQRDGQIFEIIMCDDTPCGVLRLDYHNDLKGWYLGWYLISDYQGRGIGSIVLESAKRMVSPIISDVFTHNEVGIHMMVRHGFTQKHIQDDYIRFEYAS